MDAMLANNISDKCDALPTVSINQFALSAMPYSRHAEIRSFDLLAVAREGKIVSRLRSRVESEIPLFIRPVYSTLFVSVSFAIFQLIHPENVFVSFALLSLLPSLFQIF